MYFWVISLQFLLHFFHFSFTTEPVVSSLGQAELQVSSKEQEAICNDTVRKISESKGEIFSNSVVVDGLRKYKPGSNCQYVISATVPDRVIKLKFVSFDLEKSAGCIYDYFRINDGVFGYSPLIGPFCGHNTPPLFQSSGRNVHIEFRSDDHVEGSGFRLEYEFVQSDVQQVRADCVYHLKETEAYVSSEEMYGDFPFAPFLGIDCTWIIYKPRDSLGDPQLKILAHFDKISLGYPNDCYNNSFEVYEGLPSADRMIDNKPHCTNFWSKNLETSEDKLYLHYVARPGPRAQFSFYYTILRVASFCQGDEYLCTRSFCMNRTENCQERFDKGQRCNTAFSAMRCVKVAKPKEVAESDSLYLFGGIMFCILFLCSIVTTFWVNVTHRVSQLKRKIAFVKYQIEDHKLAEEGKSDSKMTHQFVPVLSVTNSQNKPKMLPNVLVTFAEPINEADEHEAKIDGGPQSTQDDPSLGALTPNDFPNQPSGPYSIEKLANQNTHYFPLVPLVHRGRPSMSGLYGAEGQIFGLTPPLPSYRKASMERLPWVERFYASDASGSNINPPRDFNKLLKLDDSRQY